MGLCINIFCVGQAARGSAKNISQQKGSAAVKVWEPLVYRVLHRIYVYVSSKTVAGMRYKMWPWYDCQLN